jgi:hypothetical protein
MYEIPGGCGVFAYNATTGFLVSCLFFQASGHYISPWFLRGPRVQAWELGVPARRCCCLSDPKHSSYPSSNFLGEGIITQTVASGPKAGQQAQHPSLVDEVRDAVTAYLSLVTHTLT